MKLLRYLKDAPEALQCRPIPGHQLWLLYADGVKGAVCMAPLLDVGMFRMLRDERVFATARLDATWHAVRWPNAGVCIDTATLYADLRARGAKPAPRVTDPAFQRFMGLTLTRVPLRAKRSPREGT